MFNASIGLSNNSNKTLKSNIEDMVYMYASVENSYPNNLIISPDRTEFTWNEIPVQQWQIYLNVDNKYDSYKDFINSNPYPIKGLSNYQLFKISYTFKITTRNIGFRIEQSNTSNTPNPFYDPSKHTDNDQYIHWRIRTIQGYTWGDNTFHNTVVGFYGADPRIARYCLWTDGRSPSAPDGNTETTASYYVFLENPWSWSIEKNKRFTFIINKGTNESTSGYIKNISIQLYDINDFLSAELYSHKFFNIPLTSIEDINELNKDKNIYPDNKIMGCSYLSNFNSSGVEPIYPYHAGNNDEHVDIYLNDNNLELSAAFDKNYYVENHSIINYPVDINEEYPYFEIKSENYWFTNYITEEYLNSKFRDIWGRIYLYCPTITHNLLLFNSIKYTDISDFIPLSSINNAILEFSNNNINVNRGCIRRSKDGNNWTPWEAINFDRYLVNSSINYLYSKYDPDTGYVRINNNLEITQQPEDVYFNIDDTIETVSKELEILQQPEDVYFNIDDTISHSLINIIQQPVSSININITEESELSGSVNLSAVAVNALSGVNYPIYYDFYKNNEIYQTGLCDQTGLASVNIPISSISDDDSTYFDFYHIRENVKHDNIKSITTEYNITIDSTEYSVFYVSMIGNDNNEGTSWKSPFATLNKAVSAATNVATSSKHSRIYIANGDYRCNNINMTSSYIEIYGGFRGYELFPSQRQSTTDEVTILDGGHAGRIFRQLRGVLDRCTIQNGYIQDTSSVDSTGGAAVATNVTIRDCVFRYNTARPRYMNEGGGALRMTGNSNYIINCTFHDNLAQSINQYEFGYGGCGAAIELIGGGNFINCTFFNNTDYGYYTSGSGIIYFINMPSSNTCNIINCTFAYNPGASEGTIIGVSGGNGVINIVNSILRSNKSNAINKASGNCQINMEYSNYAGSMKGVGINNCITSDPLLQTPGYYTGYVPTIPVSNSSVAVGYGRSGDDIPIYDARYVTRKTPCTIGAYEVV